MAGIVYIDESYNSDKTIDVEKCNYVFSDTNYAFVATEVLGEKGYFSNDKDFSYFKYGKVSSIVITECTVEHDSVLYEFTDNKYKQNFKYFIKAGDVVFKNKEKGYKPYEKAIELPFSLKQIITVRTKQNTKLLMKKCIVTSIDTDICGNLISIGLGTDTITVDDLLNNYEWYSKGDWYKLGKEE